MSFKLKLIFNGVRTFDRKNGAKGQEIIIIPPGSRYACSVPACDVEQHDFSDLVPGEQEFICEVTNVFVQQVGKNGNFNRNILGVKIIG